MNTGEKETMKRNNAGKESTVIERDFLSWIKAGVLWQRPSEVY